MTLLPDTVKSYQPGLRDILTIFFKHKWKVFGIFGGTVLLVAVGSFLMSPTYEATSTLMVKMGREHIFRSEVGSVNPAVSFDQERIIESELQIITSRDLMERVLKKIGIETLYPDIIESPPTNMSVLEASLIKMKEDFRASAVKDSNVIKVKFQHQDAAISAQTLNLLVDYLLDKHLKIFSNPQADFLEQQAHQYRHQLDTAMLALEEFKRKHGLSALQEERNLLLEQRTALDTRLKEIQHEREGLKSKLTSLMAQIADVPKRISLSSISEHQKVIDEAKANLLRLQLEKQNLSTRYKDTSRLLKNIKKEIQIIQGFIQEQEAKFNDRVTTGKNPVYQELEIEIHKAKSEYGSLKTQVQSITGQIHELNNKLSKLDSHAKELDALQLQVDSAQKNYTIYLTKVEEAKVAQEMDQLKLANITVIQPAVVPAEPVRPKKALNILIAIVLGGVAGISFALLSEYFQGGYTRPEQATRELGLPILTSIRHYHNLT